MKPIQRVTIMGMAVGLFFTVSPVSALPLLGPAPYLSFTDSPFAGLTFSNYFHLEDFEDGLLNTPGVSGNGVLTSAFNAASRIDSVDADDGVIDGDNTGAAGDSYFQSFGNVGLSFTFNAGVLGGVLPTHVGIVWTDGGVDTDTIVGVDVLFRAFDATNTLIGSSGIVTVGDNFNTGETAEDRFFGVINAGGVSRIEIFSGFWTGSSLATLGGLEVDHLQYGEGAAITSVPEPGTLALFGTAMVGLGLARRRSRAMRSPS